MTITDVSASTESYNKAPATDSLRIGELIIIGSGPAAWTAAIYSARAGLHPFVVTSSVEVGGDLMNTTEVANFPGFPEGIQGPELMERMQAQAEKYGAEVLYEDAAALDLVGPVKTVTLASGKKLTARALIYATGSAYRKLGLSAEERLSGYGVSWCATCDGFFFQDQTIAVVGGGDSALEEATFLTRFAEKVYVIVRGTELRASVALQERARANQKVEFIFEAQVRDIQGQEEVTGVVLDARKEFSGLTHLPVTGIFVAIGSDPRTHLVHTQLGLTAHGTISVTGRGSHTSVAGVFAAGDVVDPHYRQAITAAASGATAAIDAETFLAGACP